MVTSGDILDVINKLIIGKYPDYVVYIDECPKGFSRPSFLIEAGREDRDDINRGTIRVRSEFTIICHGTVDNRFRSKTSELRAMQNTILDLFRPGFITVGDRNLEVQASDGGISFDRCWIDLYFEFNDNRSDAVDKTPLMKDVYMSVKEE